MLYHRFSRTCPNMYIAYGLSKLASEVRQWLSQGVLSTHRLSCIQGGEIMSIYKRAKHEAVEIMGNTWTKVPLESQQTKQLPTDFAWIPPHLAAGGPVKWTQWCSEGDVLNGELPLDHQLQASLEGPFQYLSHESNGTAFIRYFHH